MNKPLLAIISTLVAYLIPVYSLHAQQKGKLNAAEYTQITDVLPPSPNSASLGKYGGIEVGLMTGTISQSVPIHTFSTSNLEVPISVSYSSNGLQVDEIASRVGTGWNLNAGGVITRTVFGNVDEKSERLEPPVNYPEISPALIDFMDKLSAVTGSGGADGQPDLFSFNFNGYGGQFILDKNKKPVLLAHSALQIAFSFSPLESSFVVTTPEGVQYMFGGAGATEVTRKAQQGTACGKSYPGRTATAWYLNKIIHPSGDVVTFRYAIVESSYSTGVSQSLYSDPQEDIYCSLINAEPHPIITTFPCRSILASQSPILEEINSTMRGRVTFGYVQRLDGGDRLLTSVSVFKPEDNQPSRVFSFDYEHIVVNK